MRFLVLHQRRELYANPLDFICLCIGCNARKLREQRMIDRQHRHEEVERRANQRLVPRYRLHLLAELARLLVGEASARSDEPKRRARKRQLLAHLNDTIAQLVAHRLHFEQFFCRIDALNRAKAIGDLLR